MKFWILPSGKYYEGEHVAEGSIEVTERPSDNFKWDGASWVIDDSILLSGDISKAMADIAKTDVIVARCFEDGILVPQAWRDYRSSLRSIISASSIHDYGSVYPVAPNITPFYAPGDPNLSNVILLDPATQNVSPASGDTVQLTSDGRDGMLAILLSGPIAALTIVMPQESVVRPNQIRKLGTTHPIAQITYQAYEGDTIQILEAPSSLNATETCTLQHTEPGVWFRVS